jgi:uncharacterized membrane protein HdeD (DUF308 family)
MATDVKATGIPTQPLLLHALAKNWWLLLLRGIAAIVFGILAFAWPLATGLTLVLFFGAFALVDGVIAIIAAIRGEGGPMPRWWLVVVGILGILAGLVTFFWPPIAAIVLVYYIGAWALIHGVFEIIGAIQVRKEIDNEWMLILSGALSVLFGILTFVLPASAMLAIVWVVGAYAIIFGILFVGFAFRLKKHTH